MAEPLRCRTISRTTLPAGVKASARFPLNALDHAMAEGLAEVVFLYRNTLDPSRLQRVAAEYAKRFSRALRAAPRRT
ncbi:MAG: hypothetical protein MZU91_06725 [Desulfosudis oleivorans]|nr:hypothetical protein [Desulfosudis oleivorans]